MPKTDYFDLYEVTGLQREIMVFIGEWSRREKTPIARRTIIDTMKERGVKDFTTKRALHALLQKGYLRTAVITSNRTFYVQLKSV
jgi:hypothetical protein